jgi:hypothetical protein
MLNIIDGPLAGVPTATILGLSGRGYTVSCKIMYVTASYMTCMHLMLGFWVASSPPRTALCKILQTNFREFQFHALR